MVAPLWRGVDRLVIVCAGGAAQAAQRLCTAALADATRDSPWPVSEGSSDVGRGDAVVRLRIADAALLVSVERGVVIDDSEGMLAARPVTLATQDDHALAAAVAQAFDAALPWRRTRRMDITRSRRS